MIDTNVYLSRWPFRRLPHDTTESLAGYLNQAGVRQAWAGSFDGLLHRDLDRVNRQLTTDCRRYGKGMLIPVGTINPSLPGWQHDLRRCVDEYQMFAIRLHPNYHGYQLDEKHVDALLVEAEQRKLLVQIAVKMEDERTQHPLVQVPAVDTSKLLPALARHPKLPIQLLNSLRTVRPDEADRLAATGNVTFEISMLEGVGGVEKLLKSLPMERLLFGSYFPFFYWRSAQLKLKESSLPFTVRQAISTRNAERLRSSLGNQPK